MDLYLDNKVSQWKTKLSEFVELQDQWEVRLLEVSFPGKVYNVYGNRFYLVMGGLNLSMTIVLGDGTYDNIHSAIGEIQRSRDKLPVLDHFTSGTVFSHVTSVEMF